MLKLMVRKHSQFYAVDVCLSRPIVMTLLHMLQCLPQVFGKYLLNLIALSLTKTQSSGHAECIRFGHTRIPVVGCLGQIKKISVFG